MEGQYRRARRRAQNACRAHDRPDETVEERRLPRPCRAADDDEGRRVHLREAREQVVVHLTDEIVLGAPSLLRARQHETEADRVEVVTQAAERRRKVSSHDGGLPQAPGP